MTDPRKIDLTEIGPAGGVSFRRIPYPYRAMLAICSDLDETTDRHAYMEIMRYLNTTGQTSMGEGLGLEVGNSIYFDMPPRQFSYWNTDEEGRAMIRTLIRSGHIDCLPSYGDLGTTRAHAERALEELSRHGCRMEVWVDHATAPSNFSADIMRGAGDIPGSTVFHADITYDFGVRYVWRGRVTSIIGQNVPRNFGGLFNGKHLFSSTKAVAKEFTKGILAIAGNGKYAMHGPNEILRETELRSGQHVREFIRSNPYWGGVENGATPEGLSDVLVEKVLEKLVDRNGISILYTHLGKITNKRELFSKKTRNALMTLRTFSSENKILVTTTRRLLKYCDMLRNIKISFLDGNHSRSMVISVDLKESKTVQVNDADGMTVYIPDGYEVKMTVNGRSIAGLQYNEKDETGRTSISIPWRPIPFPLT